MNCRELHTLIPEYSEAALSRALRNKNVLEAVEDLDEALKHVALSPEESSVRKEWETIRDELLTEIRRLTQRLSDAI
ncbi:hypothetical protein AVO44_12145 [Ruegeria profundi]|uniref:Uncharacterized protein n=1 Tax=Ruegeria profundi TaxID=1685378 RepID=A0A0X3TRW2_9RHOB|nr:hypothetical protein AVO44_12145 [Ruegeria profundi]